MTIDEKAKPQAPVAYTFYTQAVIEGRTGELKIEAQSFSDLVKAVKLVSPVAPAPEPEPPAPAPAGQGWPGGDARGTYIPEDVVPLCPRHKSKMRPAKRGGFYCPAKDKTSGEYCDFKI